MFYTYAHMTPKGDIFYIGKGVADRAFSFSDRSHDWKRAVKANKGLKIEILANWETEQEAFEHEKLLISCFTDMKYKLVNKTKGGKGAYGVSHSEERKAKISQFFTGYVYKKVTCPNCNHTGGETAMRRWHFDKCVGYRPFKSRATVNGKRVYLGNYATKDEADAVAKAYKERE